MSIFDKFNRGLGKSRKKMAGAIDDMLESFDTFEEDLFVELEEILVMGDVGVETAAKIVAELQDRVKRDKLKSTFGFTDEELDRHMSAVDLKMVAEYLITSCGYQKSKAPDAVKKTLEPFMVSGASVVRWTRAVRKQAATGSAEL